MKYIGILLLVLSLPTTILWGQININVQLDQYEALQINSVENLQVCAGSKVVLGQNLIVSNNVGDVFYNWSPMYKMDDPTSASPTAVINASTSFIVSVTDTRGCTVQREITVSTRLCDDLIKQEGRLLKIYPNPAHEMIMVELPFIDFERSVDLRIINSLGQTVVQSKHHEGDFEQVIRVNIQDQKPGIYFLQLISGNKLYNERIQIQ